MNGIIRIGCFVSTVAICTAIGCAPADTTTEAGGEALGTASSELASTQWVRLHAILVSTAGGGVPSVSASSVRSALQVANKAYATANVKFQFDPASDITTKTDSVLADRCILASHCWFDNDANSFIHCRNASDTDAPPCDFETVSAARNALARRYPGKLVVIFGPARHPVRDMSNGKWRFISDGYSSSPTSEYVQMDTGMPTNEKLAHEMGHYFHLAHTFRTHFTKVSDDPTTPLQDETMSALDLAKTALRNKDWAAFDGDYYADTSTGADIVDDTAPDPGPEVFADAGLDPCRVSDARLTIVLPSAIGGRPTYHTFTPDRDNLMSYWDPGCRGSNASITTSQARAVNNALANENRAHLTAEKRLYAAVWESGDRGTSAAVRWSQSDFGSRFNSELAAGRHLVHMQAYDVGSHVIAYDGVWENGARGTSWVIRWSQSDFAGQFAAAIAAGKHIVHMQAYDVGGGAIAHDGVWEDGDRGTGPWAVRWSLSDFTSLFNSAVASGKHCVHMQAYDVGGGVIAYDGVWEQGSRGTTWVARWSQTDFAARFNAAIAAGKHLVHMQAYDVGGGTIAYDGIWEDGARGTTRAIRWNFDDFVIRNEQELASGKHLIHLQSYDVGGGNLAYDGVWEDGNNSQSEILSESQTPFVDRFGDEIRKGRHLVKMQTYRGRN